ncbi:MAG: DUF3301 domain-containing protein [Gammaproteobacteria bacterium]|nr:DUF3301 domain-containing protein [Gammaproteobacteria bacterium]MDH3446713.1 DUF3301 domain-containing protein [Gammaproteobacteria bacterium]
MFGLDKLLWLVLAAMLALYWWQSGLYKGRARDLATTHCSQLGLQLLDQSMVIVGFWPVRAAGRLVFRRSYQFEFASTGDQRYQGRLVMEGMNLKSISLEPYKLPDSE